MRSRSDSGIRLDSYMRNVNKTILSKLDPVTGLFASYLPGFNDHAWVRDNVYAVHAVWGLALGYRKCADADSDWVKVQELENVCIKVMRSLLMCMMRQIDKVEAFKYRQTPKNALHAKYSARDCSTVCGDGDWGHLQIDATSLYLLTLAQLTASGIQIVFDLEEVAFIQNLVFYIDQAYRVPDFGIWERGDKTNHGITELNASSIGMAKAALQSMNDLDLFGASGSAASVIHVMADEMQQCQAVLQAMLPRESYSKETDAALLSVISYPAFAVEDVELIDETRRKIMSMLGGKYGCCRFLRDGYKTPREDPNRLWYDPSELQNFENIECQWPLFFCFLILDGLFCGDTDQVHEYRTLLENVLIKSNDGVKLVPELYTVPADKVEMEVKNPGSQPRIPAGATPYMWAQSLYILGCLIEEGFIQAAEMDPLNRRLSTERRPDTVVQIAVFAEDSDVKEKLRQHGIRVDTINEVSPYIIQPSSVLGNMYKQLGRFEKLGLSGRPLKDVGLLSTSKLYMVEDRVFAFTPQFMDWQRFYITDDLKILLDVLKSELFYLKTNWNVPGRPLLVLVITSHLLYGGLPDGKGSPSGVIGTLKKLKAGYLAGTRVITGKIQDFLSTSCIVRLHFLETGTQVEKQNVDRDVREYLENLLATPTHSLIARLPSVSSRADIRRKMSVDMRHKMSVVRGAAQRRRTIVLQTDDQDLQRLRLRYGAQVSVTPSTYGDDSPKSMQSSTEGGTHSPAERSSTPTTPTTPSLEASLTSDAIPHLLALRASEAHLPCVGSRTDFANLQDLNTEELNDMLLGTDNLEEQADIVHYLWMKKGLDYDTCLGGKLGTTVRKLLAELYEKACRAQVWWMVRLCAALLEKRVEDLTKSVTDLLVRQKHITVGNPAVREETIMRPMNPDELQKVVKAAFGEDLSSSMLTQELLVYLGMFVRTEPLLFTEVLQLRVGLIIAVMASELARVLHVGKEDAGSVLMNLSPYEMKSLLHHILSGKEFEEVEDGDEVTVDDMLTHHDRSKAERTGILQLRKKLSRGKTLGTFDEQVASESSGFGQWVRRRRIDGALNRCPPDFYSKIWNILRKCEGLNIEGHILHQNLTKEMTRGEIKFALHVESVLNRIPEPEFRQLMVEALMILTLLAENETNIQFGPGFVNVQGIVKEANKIFIQEQKSDETDVALCCGNDPPVSCGGAAGICRHFYDSPPSGRYGTLTYMCRAVAVLFHGSAEDIECHVS